MRATTGSSLLILAGFLGLAAPADAQSLNFSPTYQRSIAAYQAGAVDPVLGDPQFGAWGFMVGLERPNRFWQPHLWLQFYEFGQPCQIRPDLGDCQVDGWALSVGPGLEFVRTQTMSAKFLPQVGFQARGQGFTGGAGLHLGVDLRGGLMASGFGRYQVIRGVHYGTIGAAITFEIPLDRDPEGDAGRRFPNGW